MIPEAAVEAAARAHQEMRAKLGYSQWDELNEMGREWRLEHMRAALEAAAPHMLSHERQQTADAHRDAVVNARTVDKLNNAIAGVEALCREEDARQTSKAYAAVDDIRATIIKALQ